MYVLFYTIIINNFYVISASFFAWQTQQNWCWEWYFHENCVHFMWSKLNLHSNEQAIETLLGWFNISNILCIWCCSVMFVILSSLAYIRINLFIFLLFSPLFIMWFLLYDYKRMIFHFTNGLSTATSTSFVVSFVIDFFLFGSWLSFLMVDVFCVRLVEIIKVFSLCCVVRNGVSSSFFLLEFSNVGDQMGSTEMMNNTIFRLPNPFLHKHYNTLIVIPDPQLNLFLF